MSKHTPGPWVDDGWDEGIGIKNIEQAGTTMPIATVPRDLNPNWLADARLISKAPEMLDLLRRAYGELNEIHARDGVPYTHQGFQASVTQECFTAVVEDARAMLAEIDGET